MVGIPWAALVEGHHYVGTDDALGIHVVFGGESMPAAVDMALESASLSSQLTDWAEAEYLESAAVGKYGAVPVFELVEAACLAEYVQSGTEIEVIGVAEYDFGLHVLLKVFMIYPLHGAYGAYRHEYGGTDVPMVRMQHTAPG